MSKKKQAAEPAEPAAPHTEKTEEIVMRQVPCPFPENDKMLKGHLETLAKTYETLFPIQQRIAAFEEKAKPFEKIAKETLDAIQAGTTQEIECTKIVYWDEDRVEFRRNDSGEVFQTRKIQDEDRQTEAKL